MVHAREDQIRQAEVTDGKSSNAYGSPYLGFTSPDYLLVTLQGGRR
jgi:hypothetical protein